MLLSYEEAVSHLFAALPMFHRQGAAAYKADLSISNSLDKKLNYPHRAFKSIHVAGTNGKGSVCSLLASIYQEAGFRVGLFTSPHIHDFRERMRVNGELIPKQFIVDWMNSVYPTLQDIPASFFELTTFIAFEAFKEYQVDIAIIEVGMGGRLDTTNVIQPELSIITNISLDHTQFLGDSIEQIAGEKAGIMKANTPVLIGNSSSVKPVFQTHATNTQVSDIQFADQSPHELLTTLKGSNPLLGKVQVENLNTVLYALDMVPEYLKVSNVTIKRGVEQVIQNTGLAGRMQIIQNNPEVISDVGHNEAGFNAILEYLTERWGNNPIEWNFVLSFVADKDLSKVLSLLPQEASYYLAKANIPRGLPVEDLKNFFQNAGFSSVQAFPSVHEAYQAALFNAEQAGTKKIFVGGSFFTLADLHV